MPEVVSNLRKARQKGVHLTIVLSREGSVARTLGQIYFLVVQSVMLYDLETWEMTPQIGRVLGGFHHRMALRITGKQPRQVRDGVWLYPLLEDAMAEAGLQEVETYVSRLQNTVTQFIATRPIMNLCLEVDLIPGPRLSSQ